ncbi:hypothetical protein CDL15_Pgr005175 [Punica granatum]|nr:hypothetical protein CDL15_Pgr005175 [Punica granatum]
MKRLRGGSWKKFREGCGEMLKRRPAPMILLWTNYKMGRNTRDWNEEDAGRAFAESTVFGLEEMEVGVGASGMEHEERDDTTKRKKGSSIKKRNKKEWKEGRGVT